MGHPDGREAPPRAARAADRAAHRRSPLPCRGIPAAGRYPCGRGNDRGVILEAALERAGASPRRGSYGACPYVRTPQVESARRPSARLPICQHRSAISWPSCVASSTYRSLLLSGWLFEATALSSSRRESSVHTFFFAHCYGRLSHSALGSRSSDREASLMPTNTVNAPESVVADSHIRIDQDREGLGLR